MVSVFCVIEICRDILLKKSCRAGFFFVVFKIMKYYVIITEVNKKFQDVWAAINKKLDKEDYENDKDNFNAHIRNYDNPHRVTAAQVGLPTAASDIEKLKQKAQEGGK